MMTNVGKVNPNLLFCSSKNYQIHGHILLQAHAFVSVAIIRNEHFSLKQYKAQSQ
jgi:hypothetical protein